MLSQKPDFLTYLQDTDSLIVRVPLDKMDFVRNRFRLNKSSYGSWKLETMTPIESYYSEGENSR